MNGRLKLKGRIFTHLIYPIIISVVLFLVGIWIALKDGDAGSLILSLSIVYFIFTIVMYVVNQKLVMQELVKFASDYAQIQKELLEDMLIPYGLIDRQGNILWQDEELTRLLKRNYGKKVQEVFKEITDEQLELTDEIKEININFKEHFYRVQLKKVNTDNIFGNSGILQIENQEYMAAIYLLDETRLRRLERENIDQKLVVGLNTEVVEVVFAVLDAHALQELGYVFVGDSVDQNAVAQLLGAIGVLSVEDDVAVGVRNYAAPLAVPGHQLGNLGADEHVLRLALDLDLFGRAVVVAAHHIVFEANRGLARLDGVVHQVEQDFILQVRAVDADAGQVGQPDGRGGLLPLVAGGNHVVRGVDDQRLHHTEPADAVLQGQQSLLGNGPGVVLRPGYFLNGNFLHEINHGFPLLSGGNWQSCPPGWRRS